MYEIITTEVGGKINQVYFSESEADSLSYITNQSDENTHVVFDFIKPRDIWDYNLTELPLTIEQLFTLFKARLDKNSL